MASYIACCYQQRDQQIDCLVLPCRRGKSPWMCLHKCVSVADSVLGVRSQATATAFAQQPAEQAVPADQEDVDKYHIAPFGMDAR